MPLVFPLCFVTVMRQAVVMETLTLPLNMTFQVERGTRSALSSPSPEPSPLHGPLISPRLSTQPQCVSVKLQPIAVLALVSGSGEVGPTEVKGSGRNKEDLQRADPAVRRVSVRVGARGIDASSWSSCRSLRGKAPIGGP